MNTLLKPCVFKHLQDAPKHAKVIETFDQALKELFIVENPLFKNKFFEKDIVFRDFVTQHQHQQVWVYYPWNNKVVHTCSEELYFKIRTARNRNIITEKEQHNYRNVTVGIAGLSVGSTILSVLAMSGGPKYLKIADFDVVEISNLNRMEATLLEIGMKKTEVAARNVWEIDPFAEISIFESGTTETTIEDFLLKTRRLDIFIDEMDSIPMKILSRQICRAHRIPVLMVTDNGDGVILDIERFDKEPKLQLLHGIMERMNPKEIKNLDFKNWVKLANKIVGNEFLGVRMKQSITQIGKSLSGIPQLGTSALVGGALVSFIVRAMANKQKIPSGRYRIEFKKMLLANKNI